MRDFFFFLVDIEIRMVFWEAETKNGFSRSEKESVWKIDEKERRKEEESSRMKRQVELMLTMLMESMNKLILISISPLANLATI